MKGRIAKKPKKSFKKQMDYNSDSSGEEQQAGQDFKAVSLQDSDDDDAAIEEEVNAMEAVSEEQDEDRVAPESDSEVTDASGSDSEDESDSDTQSNPNLIRKRKRNDPEAFATSMSKILGSKLSSSKRDDPVLSRSVTALQASKEIVDQALDKKARAKLREEKRAALEKGRVKDVLGVSTAFDSERLEGKPTPTVAETMELEKRLRKTAQRGVVKLFNAVRAAQIKGEEAAREARSKGLVGYARREEKVNEMSKQGFLELIGGGKTGHKVPLIEEA